MKYTESIMIIAKTVLYRTVYRKYSLKLCTTKTNKKQRRIGAYLEQKASKDVKNSFLTLLSYTANKFHNIFRRAVSKLFSQPNFFHDRLSSFLSRSGYNNNTKAVIVMTMITMHMTVMVAIMTLMMMTMYLQKEIEKLS